MIFDGKLQSTCVENVIFEKDNGEVIRDPRSVKRHGSSSEFSVDFLGAPSIATLKSLGENRLKRFGEFMDFGFKSSGPITQTSTPSLPIGAPSTHAATLAK